MFYILSSFTYLMFGFKVWKLELNIDKDIKYRYQSYIISVSYKRRHERGAAGRMAALVCPI